MSREVRRVPADWQHPVQYARPLGLNCQPQRRGHLRFVGLFDRGYLEALDEWENDDTQHFPDRSQAPKPDPAHYRPDWDDEARTHIQLYANIDDTPELYGINGMGTPVSPVFATEDELERFLVDEGEWFSDQRYDERSARLLVLGAHLGSGDNGHTTSAARGKRASAARYLSAD